MQTELKRVSSANWVQMDVDSVIETEDVVTRQPSPLIRQPSALVIPEKVRLFLCARKGPTRGHLKEKRMSAGKM